MSPLPDSRLLGDVGGTNARFAWQEAPGAPLQDVIALACADYPTLEDAMQAYLARTGRGVPRRCAVGIANPVTGDLVQMTNHHWSFSIEALRTHLGLEQFVVINDFTALALALPDLHGEDLRQVGGGATVPGKAIGLIGAGTGLGVSGLVPCGDHWVPLEGEGGHVALSPGNAREDAILRHQRTRFGRVSNERGALSGQGIVALHEAICVLDGVPLAGEPTPAHIVDAALAGSDPRCVEALQTFCGLLGAAAGDLALTLGARGGIYIGGGIVPRLGDWLNQSTFRQRFEDKGRFAPYMQAIPVFVILASTSPALLGASHAFDRH
jgi:glucokinase